MNEFMIFNTPNLGETRIITNTNDGLFCAKDEYVAAVLGYDDTTSEQNSLHP